MMNVNENLGAKKDYMKDKVSKKIPKLNAKVEAFNQIILHDKFLDIGTNMYEVLKEIESLENEVTKLVKKSKEIQKSQ